LQNLSDMEIRDLMYLEASAAAGTFTRAAKSLGINASTISRRVGRFEDELGLALFERRHGGVRLTSGGKAVLPHIRRALAELDAIRHAGDRNGTGIVGEVRLRCACRRSANLFTACLSGGGKNTRRSY
jgi:DNA-binding transcriptional LysR family regulator